jgi:hypothetical protein
MADIDQPLRFAMFDVSAVMVTVARASWGWRVIRRFENGKRPRRILGSGPLRFPHNVKSETRLLVATIAVISYVSMKRVFVAWHQNRRKSHGEA